MKQELLLIISTLPEKEQDQFVDELLQVIDAYFMEKARKRGEGRNEAPLVLPFSKN